MSSSTSSSDTARRSLFGLAIVLIAFEAVMGVLVPIDQGRHEVDRLAARLEQAPEIRMLVLGDSVTYGALPELPAGWYDGVSNSALGTAGNYYLLRRAVEWGHPLEHVFYVEHPDSLALEMDSEQTEVYFSSVINRGGEISHLHDTLHREDLVDAMRTSRFERFASPPSCWRGGGLRRAVYESLVVFRDRLRGDPPVPAATTRRTRSAIAGAVEREGLSVSEQSRAYHQELVALAEQHDFVLHLIPAPLPPTTRAAWERSGITRVQKDFFEELAHSDSVQAHDAPWRADEDRLFRDGIHLHIGAREAYGRPLAAFLTQAW